VNKVTVNPGTVATLQDLAAATFRVRRAISRRAGLSEVEMGTLEQLVEAPSSPSELARYFNVSTAASTGIVDRLEQRGHVERQSHPTDRRRTEVHLTDSGRAELDAQIQPLVDALTTLDAELSDADRVVVERFLREAIKAFDRLSGPEG
jgi:DNA-binding MarR family transcriptional regulator